MLPMRSPLPRGTLIVDEVVVLLTRRCGGGLPDLRLGGPWTGAPTAAMREAHEPTHLPFRSWCPECVVGRKDNPAHTTKVEDKNALPEVSLDYCFVRRENEEETLTVLVLKDRRS